MTPSTPPTDATSCGFQNTQLLTCVIIASITFAPRSIVSRNDTLLCGIWTVGVTVPLTPDTTVYTQGTRYASAAAFLQAVELSRERSPDRWVAGRNSCHLGQEAVASALESPGSHLVAAPQ